MTYKKKWKRRQLGYKDWWDKECTIRKRTQQKVTQNGKKGRSRRIVTWKR